jgi:D-alanyl-D-alanine endopeptidase (penicillin-binding protein 7)
MSLETKIRELMEAKKAKAHELNEATASGKADDGENMNSNMQGDSKVSPYTEVNPFNGNTVTPDVSRMKPAGAEMSNPKQGDSKAAEYQELDPQDQNNNTPDGSRRKPGTDAAKPKQGNSRDAAVKAAPGKGYGPDSFEKPTNPGEGQIPFKEDEQLDGEAITEEDIDATRRLGSRLAVGTRLSRAEMLRLSLMSSENRATAALARTSPVGYQEFIVQMNVKARSLGMKQSHFEDSTGLHNGNVSTAQDLVVMVNAALEYSTIRQYTTTAGAIVDTPGNRAAQVQFHNSNMLVARPDWEIGLSKTGFIREAGRCLVMQVRINGDPMIIVLLDSDGVYSRIGDATRIRRWIESGYALRLI